MSKILVPFHITDYTGSPGSVQSGFKKFYLKNGYFKLFDGATVSDLVLDRPLDGFVPLIGTITSSDTVLTALEKLQNAITSVVIPTSNLQQVVDVGNAISNYGGIGTATIQSTNFSNNRTLYLNNNSFATIKIEDNLNANHYVIIDIDTINLNGVSYNWSSIVSPPVIGTWGTLNYPTWVSGSPFVKMTAAGTFVLDNTVYYPNNNPLGFITSSALTGYVPYTGATQAVNLGTFSLTANFITTTIDSTINGLTIGKGGGNITSNTVLGNNALFKNTTGYNNSSFGEKSLFNNTEGFSNVAIGYQTLLNNILGNYNVGIGNIALYANTTGINNTSIGASSLKDNTIGYGNTAVGLQSMFLNTEGFANTAIGVQSLYNVTIGNNNVGLGFNTRTLNPSDTNSIVIGYNAVGLGPQSVVLGNTNILITRLRGAVQGGSFVKDGGTNLEFLMADGSTSIASSPAALTKIDDTNVTLTLGGNPLTALLQNVSLTLGWTGTLADGRIASAATWNAKQNALSGTGIVKSTAGVISYINGTTSQYIRGNGTLATFPTIPTVGTWGALNYPTWVSGTPFVKMTAAGTFALDTTVYYPNSNPSGFITSAALSGYVPYLGATTTVDLGTQNFYADGSTGFGTTTPIAKVHIAGSTGLAFSTNTSNHGMAYIKTVVMDSLNAPYEGDLTFSAPYWDGSLYSFPERVRIAAHTGNLGINTPAPTEKLHVVGNARITGAVYDSANLPGTAGQYLSSTVTGTSWASLPSLTGFVPTSRTLTINGTTYDLSADRSWTISSGGLPTGGTAGQILTKIDSVDYNATWQDNYADWTSVVKHIVKNNGLNGTITKGTAVYVTGSNGTNMLVGRASNVSEATSSKTMGLMQSDITTTGGTQTGFVITEGLLSGLNTAGQTAGDPVWLGVNGALIYGLINKPYAPNHLVFIGIVTKVSAGSGEIFVKVQNGFELKEIHDVDLITTTPVNGHILGFDGTLWVNKTIAGWLGYTPADASGTTNYVSKFTGTTTLGNSLIYDNGTNVGIETSVPDASAILDLTSTTRGFLPPRMTTTQRNGVSSPTMGLLVYDTSLLSLYQYNGTAWVAVGGNGGTPGIHVIVKPRTGHQVSSSLNGSTSQLLAVAGKMMLTPFIPRFTITSSALNIYCSTVGGGGNARILIYSDLNGYPDLKIYESTDLSCATTGMKTVTTAQTFTAGTTYWIGAYTSSTPTLSTHGAGGSMPIRGEVVVLNYFDYNVAGSTYPNAPAVINPLTLVTNGQNPYFVAITVQ